ncbi:DUF1156 domain-containing protein [Haloferax marisrubri]|uniref:DUF1156 domain-containing protein n=1 Tax=Haloferax marisrubri TaxID=1544719 RepID=A0A2P4NL05_9EURY|nr:DUF1156 domain-containing protein [Haloferax marisrubri]POG53811.1 DUF1156 domain-containing protein [Haloferax marisrubri]
MSDHQPLQDDESDLKRLAIEGKLPLKTVGIENLKEANPQHMPPHRYIHPWFARRPTPASRLAILASVLPEGVDSDTLLKWMQIGPDDVESGIADYVEEKKQNEGDRDGTLGEHYGYPRPFRNSPSDEEREDLHERLTDFWDGDLPTVLDPTAGGGVIPFESLRYDLPTVANELNPIPWLMLELMLEQAPAVGSLSEELNKWGDRIDETAAENLEEYFPSAAPGQTPSHYAGTYSVTCPDCGADIPLVKKWWLKKKSSSKGIAARPHISEEGDISYSCVKLPDQVEKSEFNPQDGPKSRSGAECIRCGVVMDDSAVQECLAEGDFEYEVYGVKYVKERGSSGWRAPTSDDREALKKAEERVSTDIDLHSLLQVDRYIGDEDRAGPYGVTQWRDAFTPRQLITLYEYQNAFKENEEEIRDAYEDETKVEALLILLSLTASKAVDRNSRFSPLDTGKGYPANALGGKHFTLQWAYVDNNLAAGNQSYNDTLRRIRDSYEEIQSYLEGVGEDRATVLQGDAANLDVEDDSVQAVVIDPPYYDSIIYSELSDMCYVWLREYLSETYPFAFAGELSEKGSEAVANVAKFKDVAGNSKSKKSLAEEDYESKMADIFSELYRVLEPGGVMTVMFTHKEASAWDTLTMALIRSGFTVTSTHPITSEMPQRTDTRGGGSADSTLLLTGRKPVDEDDENPEPTLWSDVQSDTREVAQEAARDLLDSGMSLTKTDVIISAFGPTLRVFADSYPVVDPQGNEIKPRKALEEAREAVARVLIDRYLTLSEGKIESLDSITEWYLLSWLIYGADTFPYDEGYQLGLGLGVNIDDIKRSTKVWRKKRGDIQLRSHDGRVANINSSSPSRSKPIDPEDFSFSSALDKVHAALHVYDTSGEKAAWEWLKERRCDSDQTFKSTLSGLLQVLPKDHDDWEIARDLSVGDTGEYLQLDLSNNVFNDEDDADDDDDKQGTFGDFDN